MDNTLILNVTYQNNASDSQKEDEGYEDGISRKADRVNGRSISSFLEAIIFDE